MKNIKSNEPYITREEREDIVQLKVNESPDFQFPGGFKNLRQSGFYFRRPRNIF